jgi:hypothetical protein
MFFIGEIFQSKLSLVRCLASAIYNEKTQSIDVNQTQLMPNIVNSDKVGALAPVYYGKTKVGYCDVRKNDTSRAGSLWKIIDIKAVHSGCGDSHNVSGKTTQWSRYFCKAKRINLDGTDHDSHEIINFSNSGSNVIKDYKQVRLP